MRLSVTLFSVAVLAAGVSPVSHSAEKHLIYVHGCCIKQSGSDVAKDYQVIVQKLRDAGFNVFFELRTSDQTDSAEQVQAYAEKIAAHVKKLIANGTPPGNITVSGYSLGSSTTLVASGLIGNPGVNYVLLAGCPHNAAIRVDIDYSKVSGRVLSIADSDDNKFGSCAGRLPHAAAFKEITLRSGEGHKVFRLADESFLRLWKEPLIGWAAGQ